MAEQSTSPLERAMELLVYAPVGLVLTAVDEFPQLVHKGRARVTSQLTVARFVGRLVVTRGTREAERLVQDVVGRVGGFGGPEPTPVVVPATEHEQPGPGAPVASNGNGRAPAAIPGAPVGDVPDEAQLAIPGYDSLSAPQVVQRLGGLVGAELDAVRAYEAAHRGRRTILARIAQLQADPT